MEQYDHLTLRRVSDVLDRRKHGFGDTPKRNSTRHAKKIKEEVAAVIQPTVAKRLLPDAINPALIVKVQVSGHLPDADWQAVDLQTLSQVSNEAVILFSSDTELTEFRRRLDEYSKPPPAGQKSNKYSSLINVIEEIRSLTPEDRIGQVLKAEGFSSIEDFDLNTTYVLDVELWCPEPGMVEVFVDRVIDSFQQNNGILLDRYSPPTGILLRVQGTGRAVRDLLTHVEVATVDLPPKADLEDSELPDPAIDDIGEILAPDPMAVTIGIVDSGINDKHPLLSKVVVGSFGVGGQPGSDGHGHGTSVAAVAAYGDLETMLHSGRFKPRFKIASARVLDDRGRFPETKLAHTLVVEAIRRLNSEYGCRVINLSLADRTRTVNERGTLWSEALDTLALELDIIIVVSAGNTDGDKLYDTYGDNVADAYPEYLFDKDNRILDPAGAANVLTVGSVAHVNGLAANSPLTIKSLASKDDPSPFTRTGPGIRNSLKPDFVDRGGNAVYDIYSQTLKGGTKHPPAGILTLNHRYTERLFKAVSGTSYAAPLVAYKAAMIISEDSNPSANMVRALLALSAQQPEGAIKKLNRNNYEDQHSVFGCGLPDVVKALYSDDDRAVLVAESELGPDQLAIFELPIPTEYQTTGGTREIRVALAFDPTVRRSRKDYLGTELQFDLVRGKASIDEIVEAYRSHTKEERKKKTKLPVLKNSERCDFLPKITSRKLGTLQHGTFTMKRDISKHGDTYYLVVRSTDRWAMSTQAFAVAVMLRHSEQISLYQRLMALIRVRA